MLVKKIAVKNVSVKKTAVKTLGLVALSACMLIAPGFALAKSKATDAALKQLESQKFEEAAKALSASFDAGDGDAAFYLGRMFELGLGTRADIKRAAGLYQLAADKNSALGQNRLALVYIRGEAGVLQDYSQALDILKKAAATGNADAQFNYATMFEKGWGVSINMKEAVNWFTKAAKQDHIGAQNKLALAYRDGTGVKKNQKEALRWFAMAASQNNPLALYEMANAFEEGKLRPAKQGTAYMLFNLAAAAGLQQAAVRRDNILRQLSSDDVNKYQKLARNWVEQSSKDRLKTLNKGA
ncbi:tetratricopeptide repeat protein [uncultured Pseudoteredinibacter sp.]|uniref:tetratricopeptide repeat protein n=1 Tax=uncultured Pseudoteredinibacter sp. TaxID=1641701 RepID=UPI002623BA6D|nr:tetratricopeptide repeat protein [uncultured Pseudoteredinibacter sp.]